MAVCRCRGKGLIGGGKETACHSTHSSIVNRRSTRPGRPISAAHQITGTTSVDQHRVLFLWSFHGPSIVLDGPLSTPTRSTELSSRKPGVSCPHPNAAAYPRGPSRSSFFGSPRQGSYVPGAGRTKIRRVSDLLVNIDSRSTGLLEFARAVCHVDVVGVYMYILNCRL